MSDALAATLVVGVLAGGTLSLTAAAARAQPRPEIALVVRGRSDEAARCFDAQALRKRIGLYGGERLAKADELRLELDVEDASRAELRVFRGRQLVARRRFVGLPAACADRRDAVALSIALALDGVVRAAPLEAARGASPGVAETNPGASARDARPRAALPDAGAASPGTAPMAASAAAARAIPQAAADATASAFPAGASDATARAPAPNAADATARAPAPNTSDATERATASGAIDATARSPGDAARPEAGAPSATELPPPSAADAKPAPIEAQGSAHARSESDDSALDGSNRSAGGQPARALVVEPYIGARGLTHALPAPVWVGALGAELWIGRTASIDGSILASTLGNSELAGGRARTRLLGGELLGCRALRFDDFAFQGCVGAAAAACFAAGRDYVRVFPDATLLWAAGLARLALRWPDRHSVSLRVFMQGHVNWMRPVLRVDPTNERAYPFWLGASGGLDLIVSLE